MPLITLPDGTQKQFEGPVTAFEVAQSIGAGLAKAAIAAKVNGKLVDTSTVIDSDAQLAIVTLKDSEAVEVIRHSTAHLLAQAVKQLFPTAQVTIGPVIEDGFFYDFAFERPFTPEDLELIEKRMTELANKDYAVTREVMSRDAAISFFKNMGEAYKAEIISDIPANEELSLYKQGDFIDLCRGPHVPSTGKLKAFKLMKLAGAYWRGDSKNAMLQRIYGTAWGDKAALDAYLVRLAEAERRDHRKIAKQLDLFHVQEEAPGMIFWHNNGWTLYQVLEQYIRQKLRQNHYQEVKTPQILDRSLWERSGHWEKFKDMMFCTHSEHHDYAIKPMNCPGAIQIFNQNLKSYRDLPLRMAEFGSCHRNEPSGTLHGIMRVRSFNQDDAHIFCTEDQIQQECADFNQMLFGVYRDFGFDEVAMNLSTRPEKRVGSDELWDKAETMLHDVIKATGLPYGVEEGGGAFYGPKIEFQLKDCIGRVWQLGTMQLDFSMPERLGAVYIAESGNKETPVMLHRVIFGSMERFIGIIIENYAGFFPPWLAPTQAVILNITDRQKQYAQEIEEKLANHGFRVRTDLRNEKIGFKIREHALQRVPYLLVLGDREQENGTVAVRTRTGKDLGSLSIEAFVQLLQQKIALLGRCKEEDLEEYQS